MPGCAALAPPALQLCWQGNPGLCGSRAQCAVVVQMRHRRQPYSIVQDLSIAAQGCVVSGTQGAWAPVCIMICICNPKVDI